MLANPKNSTRATGCGRIHQIGEHPFPVVHEHFYRTGVHEDVQLHSAVMNGERRLVHAGECPVELHVARLRAVHEDLPALAVDSNHRRLLVALQHLHAFGSRTLRFKLDHELETVTLNALLLEPGVCFAKDAAREGEMFVPQGCHLSSRLLYQPDAFGSLTQTDFARNGHGAAPRRRGHVRTVRPVAHPAEPEPPAVGLGHVAP